MGAPLVIDVEPDQDDDGAASAITAATRAGQPLVLRVCGRAAPLTCRPFGTWGPIARALTRASGVVPTVAIVDGPVTGGAALLLGLVDHVILTEAARCWVNGPAAVRRMTGVQIDPTELGGPRTHHGGGLAASLWAEDAIEAEALAGVLLDYAPPHLDAEPPRWRGDDPAERPTPELRDLLPPSGAGSYDIRTVIEPLADDGELLELRGGFAPNLVTALARIDGWSVGIVANQPAHLAGTVDLTASQKGARFVGWCDAFGIPLLTLVDTPGFSPGKDQEWRGMIRKGAQLAFAYARATVPRISVTLRKSYGGAYIVMDSKWLGGDVNLAWPTAEIAVMGARGAVEILHRRSSESERSALEAAYAEHYLNPWLAAERGLLDAVIDPADTRREIAAHLDLLATAREHLPPRIHDNMPL